jgi:iron complex transport system ATP-binding protein
MISTQNLALRIGQRVLLENFTWHSQPGQCWCIIGRNGAGKSSLLRTLAGLQTASSGTVCLQQKALAEWPLTDLARQRAFLPQSHHDAFAWRALETVLAARHPYHANRYWEESDDYHIAIRALEAMEVVHLAERDVRSLSGGERQRVAIAALLAQDTPLLMLDEPGNALDLAHQVSVMDLLARLCREQGKTVLMIAHDLNLAHGIASHALLLMGDGRWQAGNADVIMQPDMLSACLGHPIELIQHGTRKIFLPGPARV